MYLHQELHHTCLYIISRIIYPLMEALITRTYISGFFNGEIHYSTDSFFDCKITINYMGTIIFSHKSYVITK